MAKTARIIILNGVGSVGKSSTARALQRIARDPLLHVRMDDFFAMLPDAMVGHPDGVIFAQDAGCALPSLAIRTGPVMDRAMRGMRHAVAALAGQGNDLIVDDVMLGRGEAAEYRSLLSAFSLRFVGLFAPLPLLEERERARGDRRTGLARWQYDRVHVGVTYDLTIDTAALAPLDCARQISAAFDL